ncbi:MAG: Aminodeoxychorismate synthase component 1 [Bacteroidota bacterium]|jgi:para-aminobenzoate synthetase component 1
MKPDCTLPVHSLSLLRQQLASLAAAEPVSMLLGGHEFPDPYGKYLLLLALGVEEATELQAGQDAFNALEKATERGGWWFGHLSYDLKKETHGLESHHPAYIAWPDVYWFRPRLVCAVRRDQPNELQVYGANSFLLPEIPEPSLEALPRVEFQSATSFETYRQHIESIREDIRCGTYYELNHCLEFRGHAANLPILEAWNQLNEQGPAPFSAFYRRQGQTAMCLSPERFLARRGNLLISEPIKGTAPRGKNPEHDEYLKNQLAGDEKNRAENIMIVDLVRNDLSMGCIPGTVKVPELCAVRSYARVHQMTSVVCGTSAPGIGTAQHLKNTFPMGSMTGAPKHEVMQHIERYESFRRGLYSGAIGYMDPSGDFDFNVVIRTLQYEESGGRIAYHTGGAITWDSEAAQEWEECRWKAAGILNVFSKND